MMQIQARDHFTQMLRDCGENLVRMGASFEMYLGQYLADYPEERKLLLDAYKVGIPEKIIQHAGERGYGEYLEKLGPRFAAAARRSDEESAWGVQTWALALDRTADYVPPPAVVERLYPEARLPEDEQHEQMITGTAKAIIVTAGGGLGAGLAAIVFPLLIMAMFDFKTYGADLDGAPARLGMWVFIAVTFLLAALIGAAGALGGWLFGRGSEYPWAGFSVAFGTAFTMFFIAGAIWVPFLPALLWKPVALFCSVFTATYNTAARGGNY